MTDGQYVAIQNGIAAAALEDEIERGDSPVNAPLDTPHLNAYLSTLDPSALAEFNALTKSRYQIV